MAKLKMLKPTLKCINTTTLRVLNHKAGSTPRKSGWELTRLRQAVMLESQYTCAHCGRVGARHEVDHIVPLEQGGGYERSNLQLLCVECHKVKTAGEASARSGRHR